MNGAMIESTKKWNLLIASTVKSFLERRVSSNNGHGEFQFIIIVFFIGASSLCNHRVYDVFVLLERQIRWRCFHYKVSLASI